MTKPDILRIIAAILSVIGSGLLAWRVKQILDALILANEAQELNILQLMRPPPSGNTIHFANTTGHISRAKKTFLLPIGFLFLAASGVLNLIAIFI